MDREREKWAFDRLRDLYLELPIGTVEHKDEPDFRIHQPGGCLGVEITDYFHPHVGEEPPPQQQESLMSRVTATATQLARQRRLPPVWVTVDFARDSRMSKNDVSRVTSALVDEVAKVAADVDWTKLRIANNGQLPADVDHLVIYRTALREPFFGAELLGWVPDVDPSELQRVLDKKEKRLEATYRSVCGQNWLLVVIEGFRLSSFTTHPGEIQNELRSSFDRVLLLHDGGSITRVPTRAA